MLFKVLENKNGLYLAGFAIRSKYEYSPIWNSDIKCALLFRDGDSILHVVMAYIRNEIGLSYIIKMVSALSNEVNTVGFGVHVYSDYMTLVNKRSLSNYLSNMNWGYEFRDSDKLVNLRSTRLRELYNFKSIRQMED